jgi:uridine kinase
MDRIVPISYDFKSPEEIQRFVLDCEANFFRQVDKCAEEILESGVRFVTLSGPSCSGKTTASARIVSAFTARGVRVKVISLDDFYYSREELVARSKAAGVPVDFDSPTTIDVKSFEKALTALRAGEVAELPHYDFKTGECDRVDSFDAKNADIFLFEGIQAIYPNVVALFENEKFFSVYIRPSSSIEAGGELFESHELRFARRLVRDYRYRSASPDTTFLLWEGVRANEHEYLEPFEYNVDFRIDSTMAYEPALIRDLYLDYLAKVEESSPYYEKARRLMREYDRIPSIATVYIPEHSIFREFIGKEGE